MEQSRRRERMTFGLIATDFDADNSFIAEYFYTTASLQIPIHVGNILTPNS